MDDISVTTESDEDMIDTIAKIDETFSNGYNLKINNIKPKTTVCGINKVRIQTNSS